MTYGLQMGTDSEYNNPPTPKKRKRTRLGIKTVHRPVFVPSSLRNPRNLIRSGCEIVNGVTFIRVERWNRKRRAFVLEALVAPNSPILTYMRKGFL